MSLIDLFLVVLLVLFLGVLLLVALLIRWLLITTSQASNDLKESQFQIVNQIHDMSQLATARFSESLIQQTQMFQSSQMHLLDSLQNNQTHLLIEMLQKQKELIEPVLKHQEVLVNRLLAKDPYSVQVLDARTLSEASLHSESSERPYIPTDYVEAQMTQDGRVMSEEDYSQDWNDSGLGNVNP